jgi:hypothetical protein
MSDTDTCNLIGYHGGCGKRHVNLATLPSPPQSAERAYREAHRLICVWASDGMRWPGIHGADDRCYTRHAALDACIRAVKAECIEWVRAEARDCGCSEIIEANIKSQVKP